MGEGIELGPFNSSSVSNNTPIYAPVRRISESSELSRGAKSVNPIQLTAGENKTHGIPNNMSFGDVQ